MHQPALDTVKPDSKIPLLGLHTAAIERCFLPFNRAAWRGKIVTVMPGAYYIDNVFTEDECKNLTEFIDLSESLSFWSESGRENSQVKAFRDADTIEFQSPHIANLIWGRIAPLILGSEESIDVVHFEDNEYDSSGNVTDKRWQVDIVGDWFSVGLNTDMLFARYPSHGSFAPHTDGTAIVDFNQRSFYSVVVYLNTVPRGCGAGTKFYKDGTCDELSLVERNTSGGVHENWTANQANVLAEIDAVMGRILIFDQQLVHEGVQPEYPFLKYIIRSDVMFKRNPEVCASECDKKAYSLYRQAEVLSEQGNTQEAVSLFRKAFKLSPCFARIMQQA